MCSYALYPTIGLSVLNIGGIIGVYLFGVISDKYKTFITPSFIKFSNKTYSFTRLGRKTSFFLCLATEVVGGVLTAFCNDFWLWTACRFVVGLTIPAIYQIPFIIGKQFEFVSKLTRIIWATLKLNENSTLHFDQIYAASIFQRCQFENSKSEHSVP